jgi:glutamine cyclotransferase
MVVNTKSPSTRQRVSSRRATARAATPQPPASDPNIPAARRLLLPTALGAVILTILVWMLWPSQSAQTAPTISHKVVNSYPHDPDAYCQGLIFHDGFLYEGTGGNGRSSLRKVELETGRVVQQRNLERRFFGEGIAAWKDHIYQLTWRSQFSLVYELESFREIGRFPYRGEGWGLTHDGTHLIMSDGTSTLRFLEPETFRVVRQLTVRDGRKRVRRLNELEYVEGQILANIWYQDRIAMIAPQTGIVEGWIQLPELYPAARRPHDDAVLNGIAYDAERQRLFVTGKNWPRLFELQLLGETPSPTSRLPR